MKKRKRYPRAIDPSRVGKYPATAGAGGGFVWDAVLELVLEPDGHPAVKPFKRALVEAAIPFTSFEVNDVNAEYTRLLAAGVRFTQPPVDYGPVTTAVFDDT
jgi:hypothetical protein